MQAYLKPISINHRWKQPQNTAQHLVLTMENTEGPRRIRTAGKLVSLAGATVALLYWLMFLGGGSPARSFAFLAVVVLPALIPGGIIWLIGWVIEGFGSPARPR